MTRKCLLNCLKKCRVFLWVRNQKNLIIHGDNLEALKALVPFYKGKVKCIYIDPPYNTGNEEWVYNDRVNSPKIKQWLGSVVGGDSEDLTRHDKWLCMMYPRLKLLRDLLREDGVIFVSIDDNEVHNLKNILSEIFGDKNFVGELVVVRAEGGGLAKQYIKGHDYLLVYARSISNFKPLRREKEIRGKIITKNGKQFWLEEDWLRKEFGKYGTLLYEDIEKVKGKAKKQEIDEGLKNGEYQLVEKKKGQHIVVRLRSVEEDGSKFYSVLKHLSAEGKEDLAKLGMKDAFDFPKPVSLLEFLIRGATASSKNEEDIILDSFGGSGTTAQATLNLNKKDGGNRKFILVEMEDKVAKDITAERIKRAIKINDYKDGFEYCELAKSLFNEKGQINEQCSYSELATYIYFTETQTNVEKKIIKAPYIGDKRGVSYYLIYEGRDKNDLTRATLTKLKIKRPAVVYADRCLVDEDELREKGIVFKQIPYEIKVY
mgnify:CR=1 FL=1